MFNSFIEVLSCTVRWKRKVSEFPHCPRPHVSKHFRPPPAPPFLNVGESFEIGVLFLLFQPQLLFSLPAILDLRSSDGTASTKNVPFLPVPGDI